jgi:hypothetical protein
VRKVEVGHVLLERLAGEGRADAGRRVEVLERDRHPVERRLGRSTVLLVRFGERLLGTDRHERAEVGVEPLDPLEVRLDELDRRDLVLPDEAGLLGRRKERELVHPSSLRTRR